MKKLLFSLFALSVLFTSCGKDDPVPEDLRLYDPSSLTGSYTGDCKVVVTSEENKTPYEVKTDLVILKTTDANVLAIKSINEFGLLDNGGRLNNFFYTSSARDTYSFDVQGFNATFLEDGMPVYIKNWFSNPFAEFKITSASIALSNTSAKIVKASNKLDFVYTAKVVVRGQIGGKEESREHTIQYTYSVVKK